MWTLEDEWDGCGGSNMLWMKSRREPFLIGVATVTWGWHSRRQESIYKWGVKIVNTITMQEVRYRNGPGYSHYCWDERQAQDEAEQALMEVMKEAENQMREDRKWQEGMFNPDGKWWGVALKAGVVEDQS